MCMIFCPRNKFTFCPCKKFSSSLFECTTYASLHSTSARISGILSYCIVISSYKYNIMDIFALPEIFLKKIMRTLSMQDRASIRLVCRWVFFQFFNYYFNYFQCVLQACCWYACRIHCARTYFRGRIWGEHSPVEWRKSCSFRDIYMQILVIWLSNPSHSKASLVSVLSSDLVFSMEYILEHSL